jgi:hypothetical protein
MEEADQGQVRQVRALSACDGPPSRFVALA